MKAGKYIYAGVLIGFGLLVFLAIRYSGSPSGNTHSATPAPIQTVEVASDTLDLALPATTTPAIIASTSPAKAPSSAPKRTEPIPAKVIPVVATTTSVVAVSSPPADVTGTISQTQVDISPVYFLIASTTDARPPAVAEPVNREVDPRAVVALYCHGKEKDDLWKGSGNIINPKGYILTNRHVADDAVYCEVAMPDATVKLPTRDQIADMGSIKQTLDISGWRPYKATNLFIPSPAGLSDDEKFKLDFAIMKIDSINDGCELFDKCGALPAAFPYNPISNFYMPTSTAGQAFPITLDNAHFNIPIRPYEMLSYGYPATGGGGGGSHILRSDLGYAIAYLPGDKKFPGYPIAMLRKVLYGTYGGASGSAVFYKGHIVGLVYAAFRALVTVESVIPMPFITKILKENDKEWILH